MTIRTDLEVDWEASPRIITVLSPSTEITMQDLVDSCRVLESQPNTIDNLHLLNAAGKEDLGGSVKVGITVTLQNAKLAFEARPGPDYIQCNASGGNLVAVDSDGNSISPIYPTAFTQVVLANSSSATLSEQEAIQYASYNGGVSYDSTSPYSGTEFPVGTPQQPVNNIYDAYDIAIERGFTVVYLLSDLTMVTDLAISGFTFIGAGKDRTVITIPDAADIEKCTYIEANVTGYLDGENTIKWCKVIDLHYIKGYIEECEISSGTIELAGSGSASLVECYSGVPGVDTPIINMGTSGQSLMLRGYKGGIKLINKSGSDSVSIDLASGQVILDNTVTAGTIVVRGVGKLIDTSGDHIHTGTWNGVTIINEAVNNDQIKEEVWNADMSTFITSGTFGYQVRKRLLTLAQYLGLK